MRVFLLAITLFLLPFTAKAAGGGDIHLDDFEPDLTDNASLQNGAKLFVNYCMGCHEASFSRWNRVAKDLNIPTELLEENLIFGDQKPGDHMKIAMRADDGKTWFGAQVPDLTLVARVRGGDWLYTYLRGFYADPDRPWGVNNTVFKDVGMPHVLMELQGLQKKDSCKQMPIVDEDGKEKRDSLTGKVMTKQQCGPEVLSVIPGTGSMTEKEFDAAVYDLVNFLVYNAEPVALTRQRIGVFVLLFLALLFVPVYLLNREYWKGIH